MNITLNIPREFLERLTSAIERIAVSAERIAGPELKDELPKPYAASDWGTATNTQSVQQEAEDWLEAKGIGPSHWQELERQAREAQRAALLEHDHDWSTGPSQP